MSNLGVDLHWIQFKSVISYYSHLTLKSFGSLMSSISGQNNSSSSMYIYHEVTRPSNVSHRKQAENHDFQIVPYLFTHYVPLHTLVSVCAFQCVYTNMHSRWVSDKLFFVQIVCDEMTCVSRARPLRTSNVVLLISDQGLWILNEIFFPDLWSNVSSKLQDRVKSVFSQIPGHAERDEFSMKWECCHLRLSLYVLSPSWYVTHDRIIVEANDRSSESLDSSWRSSTSWHSTTTCRWLHDCDQRWTHKNFQLVTYTNACADVPCDNEFLYFKGDLVALFFLSPVMFCCEWFFSSVMFRELVMEMQIWNVEYCR